MNASARWLLVLAGLAGATGVAVGAFAAHALRARLAPQALGWIETGVLYQFVHALALLGLGALALWRPSRLAAWTGAVWAVGILLFSGSLYVLALTGLRAVVYATPVGGTLFIVGWVMLVVLAVRAKGDATGTY